MRKRQRESRKDHHAIQSRLWFWPVLPSVGWQGRGIGPALLKDALLRTLRAAVIAGIRAFAVHAKDDEARSFYEHFDFIASPTDPMHLFLLLKDVRDLIK